MDEGDFDMGFEQTEIISIDDFSVKLGANSGAFRLISQYRELLSEAFQTRLGRTVSFEQTDFRRRHLTIKLAEKVNESSAFLFFETYNLKHSLSNWIRVEIEFARNKFGFKGNSPHVIRCYMLPYEKGALSEQHISSSFSDKSLDDVPAVLLSDDKEVKYLFTLLSLALDVKSDWQAGAYYIAKHLYK